MILIKVLLFIAACNLHMISTVIVTEAGFSVGCAFILVRIVKWLIDRASHHENQLHGVALSNWQSLAPSQHSQSIVLLQQTRALLSCIALALIQLYFSNSVWPATYKYTHTPSSTSKARRSKLLAPMAASSSSILLLVLAATSVACASASTFTIRNNCGFTVWPAATPVGGGRRLDPGQTWSLFVPAGTSSGRVWGRTGCSFNGNSGSCQTGRATAPARSPARSPGSLP